MLMGGAAARQAGRGGELADTRQPPRLVLLLCRLSVIPDHALAATILVSVPFRSPRRECRRLDGFFGDKMYGRKALQCRPAVVGRSSRTSCPPLQ
ncbi:hypothetical protein BKA58DRAFT_371491 [Alternaria rosae]|uniref:uncharacterized protein n=1 Tax=Alternaria rosae TaxID=1187941 RepID=UPI001E8DAC95|nr:uncharacterized protein BKA58DRAFT_395436 [Alternaria rosae]XP_046030282.1 uncharacterized protein BKA58DRAFT_371491 [Alternaria rosae]KAH6845898.1 hypothetical protein BKA58DRAFT_395436 [Alternaria rosae]KAH6881396.1 hypothetical protein BKA58DRAFT_371491 [Alternaria rosae]